VDRLGDSERHARACTNRLAYRKSYICRFRQLFETYLELYQCNVLYEFGFLDRERQERQRERFADGDEDL